MDCQRPDGFWRFQFGRVAIRPNNAQKIFSREGMFLEITAKPGHGHTEVNLKQGRQNCGKLHSVVRVTQLGS
jgi:hypothetical protein